MKFVRIMIIPEEASGTKQFRLPSQTFRGLFFLSLGIFLCLGYFALDYKSLLSLRDNYTRISAENEGLKGEARLVYNSLEETKRALRQVHDYSVKLTELTNIQAKAMSQKTGIGPLTPAEMDKAQESNPGVEAPYVPLGINLEKLVFRPVFDRIHAVKYRASDNALKLQKLLSNLSQKKSLLSTIPSRSPVNGWIASGFGYRISPFTGRKDHHNGIDVAGPVGTPIRAPADGVAIFVGAKAGFGNFIMLAHGNGIVSRYGHNAQNMVRPGQKVRRGQQIGTVGMTGRTTGPHLHYEVLVNGRNVNPRKFMLDL